MTDDHADYREIFGRDPEPWREPLGALILTLADESAPAWQLERARAEAMALSKVLNQLAPVTLDHDLGQRQTDLETITAHLERGTRPTRDGTRFWGGLEWAIARVLFGPTVEKVEERFPAPRCGKPIEGDLDGKGCRRPPLHDGTCGPF